MISERRRVLISTVSLFVLLLSACGSPESASDSSSSAVNEDSADGDGSQLQVSCVERISGRIERDADVEWSQRAVSLGPSDIADVQAFSNFDGFSYTLNAATSEITGGPGVFEVSALEGISEPGPDSVALQVDFESTNDELLTEGDTVDLGVRGPRGSRIYIETGGNYDHTYEEPGASGTLTIVELTSNSICIDIDYVDHLQRVDVTINAPMEESVL